MRRTSTATLLILAIFFVGCNTKLKRDDFNEKSSYVLVQRKKQFGDVYKGRVQLFDANNYLTKMIPRECIFIEGSGSHTLFFDGGNKVALPIVFEGTGKIPYYLIENVENAGPFPDLNIEKQAALTVAELERVRVDCSEEKMFTLEKNNPNTPTE